MTTWGEALVMALGPIAANGTAAPCLAQVAPFPRLPIGRSENPIDKPASAS